MNIYIAGDMRMVAATTLYAVSGSLGGALAICLIIIVVLACQLCTKNDTKSILDSEDTNIEKSVSSPNWKHVSINIVMMESLDDDVV